MKQCDICQGRGQVTVIRYIKAVLGFSINADGSHGVDTISDTVKEQCLKCDGKGMIKP